MMELLFATGNQHKIVEVQALLPKQISLLSLADVQITQDIPETSDTIRGNAIQKVKFVNELVNINCFADDTGLEVEALNGAPGVHSARYAGENKNSLLNMEKLLQELQHFVNRKAQFKTVIALYLYKDQKITCFEGILHGEIIRSPKGKEGFGYDPIFVPAGYRRTLAEMTMKEKNRISHRSLALQKLVSYLSLNL